MSDSFTKWRKAQNPLRIGGPLDDLLDKAFHGGYQAALGKLDALMRAEGLDISTAMPAQVAKKIKRTIWISRDNSSLISNKPEYRNFEPRRYTDSTGSCYGDHISQLASVPAAVEQLGATLDYDALKRAVLIGGVWSLREADGA